MRFACILAGLSIAFAPLTGSAQERDWLGSHQNDGPYLGLSAGWLHLTDVDLGADSELHYDEGFVLGIQGGYKLGVLRGEIEFEYGRSGFDDATVSGATVDVEGDFNLFRWTAALHYDFDNLTRFTPYFGGGLGGLHADGDDATVGGASVELEGATHFTAHGEAGLAVEIGDGIAVVPAYRFIWVNSGEDDSEDDKAHVAKLGLRFHF